jgi:hypothetical protein
VKGGGAGRRPFGADAEPLDLEPLGTGSGRSASAVCSEVSDADRVQPRWYVLILAIVMAAALAHVVGGHGGNAAESVLRGIGGDEQAPPGWERGAVGPLQSRLGTVSAWTGSEIVIWGGSPGGDGAAYNPTSASWRTIAPAPFPVSAGAVSAWTGLELLIWGGEIGGPPALPTGSGGAYDAAADRWRRLPPAPLTARRALAGVWTGDMFVIVGGTAQTGAALADAAAYEPNSDRWRRIAALPIQFRQAIAVWTGQEVVVFGTTAEEPPSVAGVAWHPASDRWRVLPPSPLTGSRVTAVWTSRELIAWDDNLRSAALEVVSGRWRALPDIPSIPGFCDPAGVVAGRVVFAEECGRGALYDPRIRQWSATTHPYFLSGQPVWTGRRLLWWTGAFRGSKDSIWMFAPAQPAEPADTEPPPSASPATPDTEGRCALSLSQRADPTLARPGQDVVWWVAVANTSSCRFSHLSVNAFISTSRHVRYWLVAEDPLGTEAALHSFSLDAIDSGVMWPELGPLGRRSVREFAIRTRVAPDSAPGQIDDDVDVFAVPAGRPDSDGVTERIRLAVAVVDAARPGIPTPGAGGHRGGGSPPAPVQPGAPRRG